MHTTHFLNQRFWNKWLAIGMLIYETLCSDKMLQNAAVISGHHMQLHSAYSHPQTTDCMRYEESLMRKWYLLASIHFKLVLHCRQLTYCICRSELLVFLINFPRNFPCKLWWSEDCRFGILLQSLVIWGLSFWHPSLSHYRTAGVKYILYITDITNNISSIK